jgi:hypothetical protein
MLYTTDFNSSGFFKLFPSQFAPFSIPIQPFSIPIQLSKFFCLEAWCPMQ